MQISCGISLDADMPDRNRYVGDLHPLWAVSYTHLDVYKRQEFLYAYADEDLGSNVGKGIIRNGETDMTFPDNGSNAVSYTHLDVYKRQDSIRTE